MSRACCFTGHRELPPLGSEPYNELMRALQAAVADAIALGCTHFLAGGATGFDMLAAELILLKRRNNPSLELTVCVPYLGHDSAFSAMDRYRFKKLKEQADRVLFLSDRYTPGCFWQRNRYMVEHADVCIAYVRRKPSGSAQTMRMAEKRGLRLLLV